MKRIHTLSVLAALALCACGCGFLDTLGTAEMKEASAGVYDITIPAVMYDLPIAFKTSDKIYLYNQTQDAFACDQSGTATVLHPGDLNENGTQCVIKGKVSFYKYNFETERRTLLTAGENDVFRLLLNVSEVNTEDPEASYFYYEGQDGTKESAFAHYYAQTSEVRMNTPGSAARFYGMQSLLTAGMSFRRDGALVEPTLKRLTVTTEHGALASVMHALSGEIRPDKLTLRDPDASEIYLALASEHEAEIDRLVLQALDSEGNFYDAFAEMPYGGLMAGANYDSRLIFNHTMSLKAPTVTRSDGGSGSELTPNADNTYEIHPEGGKIAIRIDGDCTGYNFVLMDGEGTVTLGGGGTAYYPFEGGFLSTLFNNMNVVLDSDYTINCPYWMNCIMADVADLKFSTTGGTYKLTVTCQTTETFNLKGLKARNYSVFSDQDPAGLAAKGFTVKLTDEKDNGDGTGTYVYTVAPAN